MVQSSHQSLMVPVAVRDLFIWKSSFTLPGCPEAAPALKKWGGQEKFFRTTPIFHESHAHLEKEEPS